MAVMIGANRARNGSLLAADLQGSIGGSLYSGTVDYRNLVPFAGRMLGGSLNDARDNSEYHEYSFCSLERGKMRLYLVWRNG